MVFSQSGTTRHLIELVHHATASGGQAMAVTAPDSPLALASQYNIGIQPYEQVEVDDSTFISAQSSNCCEYADNNNGNDSRDSVS